jgi:uncharacterized protein YjiS (DUF1127 family)
MEADMLARDRLDMKITDYQSLTPVGQALLRDQALAQARAERAKAIRALFRGLGSWIAARWAAFRRWRELKAAVATLETFDDRQLKDIGLRRSEITGAVHGYNNDETRRSGDAEPRKLDLKLHCSSRSDKARPARRVPAPGRSDVKTAA